MPKLLVLALFICLLTVLAGTGAFAQPAYPESISRLAVAEQVRFIQFIGERGWYDHFVLEANQSGVLLMDGLGNVFYLLWTEFFSHTAQDHGWTNQQIDDFFAKRGIEAQGSYPQSVTGLSLKQRIAFADWVKKQGWFRHRLVVADPQDLSITIVDGLGNSFRLSIDRFFQRTKSTNGWSNEALWEWWEFNRQVAKGGKRLPLVALAVIGLGIAWLVLVA